MITIYKNGNRARVPSQSFKSMFQPYGWSTSPVDKDAVKQQEPPPPPEKDRSDGSKAPEELQKMNDQELRQYAALLGIKTKNLQTRDEVMEAIEAAQK